MHEKLVLLVDSDVESQRLIEAALATQQFRTTRRPTTSMRSQSREPSGPN